MARDVLGGDIAGDAVADHDVNVLALPVLPSGTNLIGRTSFGIADTIAAAGATGAAPTSGTSVAATVDPPDGVYKVTVVTFEGGTVDTNRTNMNLRNGTTVIGALTSTATPIAVEIPRVTMTGTNTINVVVGASAGGAGSIYIAQIVATRIE